MNYRSRRQRLLLKHPQAVFVLPAAPRARMAHDIHHRYRPDPDVIYLTGWDEPESVAVLRWRAGAPSLTLFVRPRDLTAETWSGRRHGPEGARLRFGAELAYAMDELPTRLPELLVGADTLYYPLGRDRGLDDGVLAAVEGARRLARKRHASFPHTIVRPEMLLGPMRLIKDDDEISALRAACLTTAAAHLAAMRITRPGLWERDLEAVLEYTFRRHGADGPANPSIVGGGANATVLHYDRNDARLRDGDLVLVDAGAAQGHYVGDISRTYPVNGRFTSRQRQVYEVVLAAEEAAIGAVAPGATLGSVHEVACRQLVNGLCLLGVLRGDPAALMEQEAYTPFYPHSTSHWLGLDVHDAGPLTCPPGDTVLEPGMVLTVEPGLYFAAEREELPAGLAGLGVRVEDDVLVTKAGCEVLTAGLPRTVAELEAVVGREAAQVPAE
ncbi:MAG: aminopeptidase P N-terminal domain-containing protein [bacterium]